MYYKLLNKKLPSDDDDYGDVDDDSYDEI